MRPLCERPDWVRTLADWHYAEWGTLYGTAWSWQAAYDELSAHAARNRWPMTWVAEQAGELVGSVSLVESDAPSLDHLGSPWLASLYVTPAARGQGVAKRLVQSLCIDATEQQISRLLLFTPSHREYYAALGWTWRCRDLVNQHEVDVMTKVLPQREIV